VRLGRGETSRFIVLAMAIGLVALLVLGIHVPGQLSLLLRHAAAQVEMTR